MNAPIAPRFVEYVRQICFDTLAEAKANEAQAQALTQGADMASIYLEAVAGSKIIEDDTIESTWASIHDAVNAVGELGHDFFQVE